MALLLEHILRSRRDVILVCQRLRRLARLLQIEGRDQALLVASGFAIAQQALEELGPAKLHAELADRTLDVFAVPHGRRKVHSWAGPRLAIRPERNALLRLTLQLPREQILSEHDLAWIAERIPALEPLHLYAEFQQQNREMLALLQASQPREIALRPAA